MKRRDFLRLAGFFTAAAQLGGVASTLTACGDDGGGGDPDGPPAPQFLFPQGIASGDPRETSVVLWTRCVPANGTTADVPVTVQVATDEAFTTLVVEEAVTATEASDHTVRILVTDLAPKTRYFYRFVAGTNPDRTVVGRTRTAPAADDPAPVTLAWVSCQDLQAGFYGAYAELIREDEARPEAEQIQFLVHLGDFIYETRGGNFQRALDANFQPITLVNPDGSERLVPPFPDGGMTGADNWAATLADYRHLYKFYLSDPLLQAARARWPFVQTWDDHEFANDCWQTQANFSPELGLDEPAQARKVAANQAWFEFVPCQLTGAPGVPGVTQRAKDFTPTTVEDTGWTAVDVDETNLVTETNNVAALDSMTIYRSFRFGAHCELVITDERSYRSDHAIPEELTHNNFAFFDQRNVLPLEAVNVFDAGATANGGAPPADVFNLGNPRREAPPGTMLGAAQKQWWKDTMAGSTATWKLWGSEVSLLRLFVQNRGAILVDRIANGDAWDGYPTERRELMTFLRDEGVDNVVAIVGDIHAHFAGIVMDDYDAAKPAPAAVELCAAGISSNSLFSFYEAATRSQPEAVRNLVVYDARPLGGDTGFRNNLNVYLLYGGDASIAAYQSDSIAEIEQARDAAVNPHLRYVDSDAQGYGILTLDGTQLVAELVTVNRPIDATAVDAPGILRRARFVLPAGSTDLPEPTITGAKPFPLT